MGGGRSRRATRPHPRPVEHLALVGHLRLVGSVAVAGFLTLGLVNVVASCGSPEVEATKHAVEPNARVVRVVDGDTIVADIDGQQEKVRLIGIDTPESVKPGAAVECYGKEASAHAKQLLTTDTDIRLELDAEARDRYDRLLAYVYRASDGLFVNLAMVTDGYANSYTFKPNVTHTDQFRDAVTTARHDGVGVWSACADDLPFPADQH